MSLKTRQLDTGLSNGLTTEGLQKDGSHATFAAAFDNIQGEMTARLQHSIDGEKWANVPGSETILTTGDTERLWTENIMPRGTMVRLNITNNDHNQGTIVSIKLLSNE